LRLHLSARARRTGVAGLVAAGMLAMGGCSRAQNVSIKRLAQPIGASDRTESMHQLWMWSWLAAMIVGVVVWGLILYAAVKFRRRRDDEIPVQTRYNLPIEILYTAVPIVIVIVLFYFTVQVQDQTLAAAKTNGGKPDHTVTVVGQQWSWTFNYVKDPALDGKTTVFESGTPAVRPTLELPVNKSVRINLRSPDVIHSFWVPAFLFKMDVFPGSQKNHFDLTPTRIGTYRGRCAELCGTYHSRMLFNVKVVSESDYAAYLRKLKQEGNTGLALGGSEANQESGSGTERNGGPR
jgi:cytochrome c oxidase subunit 2